MTDLEEKYGFSYDQVIEDAKKRFWKEHKLDEVLSYPVERKDGGKERAKYILDIISGYLEPIFTRPLENGVLGIDNNLWYYGLLTSGHIVENLMLDCHFFEGLNNLVRRRVNMLNASYKSQSKQELYDAYCFLYDELIASGYKANFGANTFSKADDDFGVSSYLRHRMYHATPYKGFGISAQSMNQHGLSYNVGKNTHNFSSLFSNNSFGELDTYLLPKNELAAKYLSIAGYCGCISLDVISEIIECDSNLLFHDELIFLLNKKLVFPDKDNNLHFTRNGFIYYGAALALLVNRLKISNF